MKKISKKQLKVEALLKELMVVIGYDKSESASENFAYQLCTVTEDTIMEIENSHEDGLCYYSVPDIAKGLCNKQLQELIHRKV